MIKHVKEYVAKGYPVSDSFWRVYVFVYSYTEENLGNGLIKTCGEFHYEQPIYCRYIVTREKSKYDIEEYEGGNDKIAIELKSRLTSYHWKTIKSLLDSHKPITLFKEYE